MNVTESALPRRHVKRASIFMLSAVALATFTPVILVFQIESPVPFLDRITAATLWVCCLIPLWLALGARPQDRSPLPFLPVIGIVYGWYYALPITYGAYNQHWRIRVEPDIDYAAPLRLALIGWLMLLLGYRLAGARWHVAHVRRALSHEWRAAAIESNAIALVVLGLTLSALIRWVKLPLALYAPFQFGNTLFLLGVSLLVIRQVNGIITLRGRMFLWGGTSFGMLLALSSGSVAPLVFIWAAILFSVWLARQSLGVRWTLVCVVAALSALLFKGVIDDYRKIQRGQAAVTGVAAGAATMGNLLSVRIAREGIVGAMGTGQKATSVRSANLELFADVIRRTPDEVDHWHGKTYLSLIGIAIPRVLWPDKPTKELGQAFGKRYGYVAQEDYGTSFNFPFLVEFYANFGMVGVWIGMLVVGVIYRVLDGLVNRPGQDLLSSCFGLVLLLPLLNIESDFSLVFGGLFLNGVLLWLLLRTLQRRAQLPRASAHASVVPQVLDAAHQRLLR